jgi:hypothetical protein
MKPNDVKRSVQLNRHDRSLGDAPSLGRVSRTFGQSVGGESKRGQSGRSRRGSRQTRGQNRLTVTWTVLLVGCGLLFFGGVIWLWFSSKVQSDGPAIGTRSLTIEPEIVSNADFTAPSKEQALEIVRQALASRTLKSVDSFFRKGTSTDEEILSFLEKLEVNSGRVARTDWLSNMDRDGLAVEGVLVGFTGLDQAVERMAFLTPDAEGKWQVDFDAFARTVRPSWDEFLKQGVDRAVVRVFVAQDVYFNGPFADESQWICYAITSPDVEETLHGYCRIGSKVAEKMATIFSDGSRAGRATLALQRVNDAGPRQFEIAEVYANDWLLPAASK